ncbi:SPARC [Bagarius yarrelli]|uniref:SPARC n=1 Tax=Bagarius yarrelli TaxID=175774 RepID=A0A556VBQ7_BAGYA|nr:SPARC [Bagarius yarrelli]
MTPVQIRAATNLSSRIKIPPKSRTEDNPGHEVSVDLCENVHCKRGKTCKLNDKKNPGCVCQEPADCPPTLSEFDHVCGTDNQTYNSSCQLFAIKCSLEGSKKGHRLHLDYTGSCKFIPPCLETELIYFPLRMKDWMKNVLLQLYKQDSLTAKQRSKVQKMYEDERRLHASYHLVKRFLVLDFEKNYSIYIYPVHWQFAQLDLHPSDRFLSHSELAPLRAPLVPMEHCTSVFFQACDEDKDKLLSFMEWCHCFGVRAVKSRLMYHLRRDSSLSELEESPRNFYSALFFQIQDSVMEHNSVQQGAEDCLAVVKQLSSHLGRTFLNLPRPSRTSPNLPEPTQTFPNLPEPSRPSRTSPNLPRPSRTSQTFPNLPEPPETYPNLPEPPPNLPEPTQTLPKPPQPSRTYPRPFPNLPETFPNLPEPPRTYPDLPEPTGPS